MIALVICDSYHVKYKESCFQRQCLKNQLCKITTRFFVLLTGWMLIYCKMVGSAIVPINKANQHLSCKWSKREVLHEKLINVNQNFSNWQVVQKVSGAWKIYCNLWDLHCSRWSNCFISFLAEEKASCNCSICCHFNKTRARLSLL